MTDQKTSVLPEATSLASTDLVYAVVSGQSRRMTAKSFGQEMTGVIDVKRDHGAAGDGVTDDTAAIQAAIDESAALIRGADVTFPFGNYLCGDLILKSKVRLIGSQFDGYRPHLPTTMPRLVGKSGATWIIDSPVTEIQSVAVQGLGFTGTGSGNGQGGINLQLVRGSSFSHNSFDNFDNQAIKVDAGGTSSFIGNFAQGCLLDRVRASKVGVIQLTGSDHWIEGGEYTASSSLEGDVSDANLYICAVAILGSSGNNWVSNVQAEISDVGLYLEGSGHKIIGVRSDLNYGHGFEFAATNTLSLIVGCHALRNGRGTDDTYNDFEIASDGNRFTGCFSASNPVDPNRVKHAFNDTRFSDSSKNYYVGCGGQNQRQKEFNINNTSGGAVTTQQGPAKTFTDLDLTPDVSNYNSFKWLNPSTMTITDFDNGLPGQTIHVVNPNNTNVTIANNASIITSTGADKILRQSRIYSFFNWLDVWYEIGGDVDQVGADVGDAAKTLNPGSDEQTQIWGTALTAIRAVTLSTTASEVWNGAKFRVVRTANATGAFNLNVGTGPIKALAAAEWCEVEYNGTAWVLTAFGSL